ncbi:UNVERIFIED_CONTAM: hypothetical protein Sangu_2474500 [Sesamum angustifolium]|uniref:Transposase n=1 Tax=Sesamum angustifolium TaxID=2727405 RepID=A0AAW2IR91_9LAMI
MPYDMDELVHDAFGVQGTDLNMKEKPNEQVKIFYKLLDDAQKELYPGCKQFSKLAFLIRLFHPKCTGKWSNKTFIMLLELLKEAFPDAIESLPNFYYEVQKIIGALGLTCVKIHGCPNNCMLYLKEHANDTFCLVCKASRYVENENNLDDEEDWSRKTKKVPTKILRYFLLKPRLQRLSMLCKTTSFMSWHHDDRIKDAYMRQRSDSPLCHAFDRQHRDFGKDPRNVKLGVVADGFSLF